MFLCLQAIFYKYFNHYYVPVSSGNILQILYYMFLCLQAVFYKYFIICSCVFRQYFTNTLLLCSCVFRQYFTNTLLSCSCVFRQYFANTLIIIMFLCLQVPALSRERLGQELLVATFRSRQNFPSSPSQRQTDASWRSSATPPPWLVRKGHNLLPREATAKVLVPKVLPPLQPVVTNLWRRSAWKGSWRGPP